MKLYNEFWCVIECSDVGEVFEPEFFKSEKEAKAAGYHKAQR